MLFRVLALLLPLALAVVAPSIARQAAEPAAIATEVNLASAAATGFIGSLQGKINTGTATAADIAPDALRAGLARVYQQLAGHPIDAPAASEILEIRTAIADRMDRVVDHVSQEAKAA